MEFTIRLLLYSIAGLALVTANLWFFRSIYGGVLSANYVILPFNVIDPSGQAATDKAGLALAQMMAARLSNIQAELRGAQSAAEQEKTQQSTSTNPLAVTALFIPRPVDVPTSLFEPIAIKASVGGVEVGGIIEWFHKLVATERAIKLTTYERSDRAVITADLSDFAPTVGHMWFESDKHPDEIATNAAYALIRLKQVEKGSGRIKELDLVDFRLLLETIFQVNDLNRRAIRGYSVDKAFRAVLPSIETQLEKVPTWPELIYLAGSVAEGAGNVKQAALHYRRLQGLTEEQKKGADVRVVGWVRDRLTALGAAGQQLVGEVQARFVSAASEFARRMALEGPDPEIVFVKPSIEQIQATWNSSTRQYEVNPANADTAGLPQYVALMGRFLDRNFDRCFGGDPAPAASPSVEFWNEFRYSIVDYLIQTQAEFQNVLSIGKTFKLYTALKEIEAKGGSDPAKRLAFALLDDYECNWAFDNIGRHIVEINRKLGLMPEQVILQALTNNGFATS